MKTVTTNKKCYINSLNGLKAIALIMIFWWHSPSHPSSPDIGARMTELFFVASGFLIGYNHFDKRIDNVYNESKQYTIKKLRIIFPLHLIAFVTVVISILWQNGAEYFTTERVFTGFYSILLLNAWSNNSSVFFAFNGAIWFLSSLMFCYTMYPVILQTLQRSRKPYLYFALFIMIRLFLELQQTKWKWYGIEFNVHVSPIVRFFEFSAGMSLIPIFRLFDNYFGKLKNKFIYYSIMETIIVFLYVYLVIMKNTEWIRGYFVILACIMIFILSSDEGIVSKILSFKPLVLFSSIQLQFFILHQPIIKVYNTFFYKQNYSTNVVVIVLFFVVLLLAIIYKLLFEGIKRNLLTRKEKPKSN